MQQEKRRAPSRTPLPSFSIRSTAGMKVLPVENICVSDKVLSWDTFRTFYPLLSLTSPVEFAQIVDNYIDAFRVNGWMPECRANHLPGWTQGGTSIHTACLTLF